jgi:hypothetical protein
MKALVGAPGDIGVTLVDLLVALTLFATIMLGVLGVWRGAQEAYFTAVGTAEVEQNLRAALDFMVREIRTAGRDVTVCAFDFAGLGTFDCAASKVAACRARLGGADPSTGCQGIFAIPAGDATATTLRVRADRNDSGTIAGTLGAAADDQAEENVLYALASGSPPCPPRVPSCITRDDGNGPVAMVAIPVEALRFTYFPRSGYPPCDGDPVPSPCPAFPSIASQQDADNIARIRISLRVTVPVGATAVQRALEGDVSLMTRS